MLSDEESLSCDRLIDFRVFLHVGLELLHHILSLLLCLLREIVSKHHLYTCDGSRAGKCPTSCGSRMDKGIGVHHTLPDLLCRDECRYRHHTSTERLPECHDIWSHSPVIDCKHLSRTSEPCLDFICDEESSVLSCHLADSWPVVIRWNDRTCLSLDGLDDDSCDSYSELLTGLELYPHSICISIFYEVDRSAIHLSYRITIEGFPHHGE